MKVAAGAALAILLAGAAAFAQDIFFPQLRGGPRPRLATADAYEGRFNFCRLMYTSSRREPGGQGWWTDYPNADLHFTIRLSELTKTRVSLTAAGNPNHIVVRPTDPELFSCPFMIISDAGTARFTDEEVVLLREYLVKGGFLWVDDFWGTAAWTQWSGELARILPPLDYPIRDLTPEHPLYRTMFQLKEVPQIPNIRHWRVTGGETSERGYESQTVNVRGVSDANGRLMVLMTHNTDIADAWEREADDPAFFYQFSPNGYAVGINVFLYAMTH